MGKTKLNRFFSNYLDRVPLIIKKQYLQNNYSPKKLLHRDDQMEQLASILAPALRGEKPSNVFLYGKTGTGKTAVTNHVLEEIGQVNEKKKVRLVSYYLNCKLKRVADTEYRILAQLAREFGTDVPATGLPTDEVYRLFVQAVESKRKVVILVLDEIDQLVKKAGDEILYNLTRLNAELSESQISVIGISNDLTFADNLDPRVKSSLSEEELIFAPYNALQLQDILRERAKVAFSKTALEQGVIEKCAAYTAREHGDARRAIELLRVAGELAERTGEKSLSVTYIDQAEEKIERDRIFDIVGSQPKQFQATLFSIFDLCNRKVKPIFTGEVYEIYTTICESVGLSPLTQRRVSDIIAELDMLGIINARVVSKGRYGRTREIGLAIPSTTLPKINVSLKEGLGL
ncbi:cell division control protein Cdc6 [archaeon]|nr:cell division control protein Cdc6 [archaeon]|tara:strand:+ start:2631 stop:3839 length:1209 start_codon:yes stop_codon:yes gene_type:complete